MQEKWEKKRSVYSFYFHVARYHSVLSAETHLTQGVSFSLSLLHKIRVFFFPCFFPYLYIGLLYILYFFSLVFFPLQIYCIVLCSICLSFNVI